MNVARAVHEYEAAGVSAMHIEDQFVPKRSRPDGKPQLIPAGEHADKIRAAVEARSDPDFCIIARTDALTRLGLNEAVRRANLYVEAGADLIFVHGAKEPDDLRVIACEIHVPNIVNYSTLREGHVKPLPSFSDLERLGFKLVILPGELLFGAAKAMLNILGAVQKHEGLDGCEKMFLEIETLESAVDAHKYRTLEDRFLPGGPSE